MSNLVMYELVIIRYYLAIMAQWTGLFLSHLISVISTTEGQEV